MYKYIESRIDISDCTGLSGATIEENNEVTGTQLGINSLRHEREAAPHQIVRDIKNRQSIQVVRFLFYSELIWLVFTLGDDEENVLALFESLDETHAQERCENIFRDGLCLQRK